MRGKLPVVVMLFILAHGICLLFPQTEHKQQLRHTPSQQQDTERQLHKGAHTLSERHDKNNLKTLSKTKTHAQISNILNGVINFQANVGSHDTDKNTVVADPTTVTESGGTNTVGQQQSKSGIKMPSDPEAGHIRKQEADKLENRNDHGLADLDINSEESKQRSISSIQSSPKTDNYHNQDQDQYQSLTNLPRLDVPVRGGQQIITASHVTVNQYHPDMTTGQITEPSLLNEEDDNDLSDDTHIFQNVPYDYPTDYYACGSCKCHHIGRGSKNKIYADCSHKVFNNDTFAKEIPSDTVTLDMCHTNFNLNTFEGFVVFPSLTTLILNYNHINSLRNMSCPPAEKLKISTLNLNNNRISNIDDNSFACLPDLEYRDLSHNLLLKIFKHTLWGAPHLTYLALNNNGIFHIEEGAFDIHTKLRHLYLKANPVLSYDSLSPRLFRCLTSVTDLNIRDLKPKETSYPNSALGQLKSLQNLEIDGMNDVEFGPELESLTNLTSLLVWCYPLAGTLNVSASYLQYMPYLKVFEIGKCYLNELSYKVYKSVPFLKYVAFREVFFPFDQFFDHLVGLKNSEVTHLVVTSLAEDDPNPCRCLSKRHSQYIQHMRKLQEFYLVRNRITFIGADFAADLPSSIRKIDLTENLLVQIRSILPFCAKFLPNLVTLIEDGQNRISYWSSEEGIFQTETCDGPSLVLPASQFKSDQSYSNRILDRREVKRSNVLNQQINLKKHLFIKYHHLLSSRVFSIW